MQWQHKSVSTENCGERWVKTQTGYCLVVRLFENNPTTKWKL